MRSQWEKLKRQDDRLIRAAIDAVVLRTTDTIVCLGGRTASRRWVNYELQAVGCGATGSSRCTFRAEAAM
jgi:hypothetical protein